MFFGRRKPVPRNEPGAGPGAAGPGASSRPRPALFQNGPSISQSGGFGTPGSVIRMPVGAMGVAIVVFVALMVVAYEVGYARGAKSSDPGMTKSPALDAKKNAVTSIRNATDAVPIEPGSPLPGIGVKSAADPAGVIGGRQARKPETPTTERSDDPTSRKIGLNYCIVATYGKDDAERLSAFLRTKGVDTVVVSTHNRKLFQVVDLRGFTPEEYRGTVFEEHHKRLRQFGREWKEKQHGPDDLKDIWVEKFTGGATSHPD